MKNKIRQPKNVKFKDVSLTYAKNYSKKWTNKFDNAQKSIDSSCLRYMSPLVPLDTGDLKKNGEINTVVGNGEIIYTLPYARKVYYTPDLNFQGAPLRGAYWFERMKTQKLKSIQNSAKRGLRKEV